MEKRDYFAGSFMWTGFDYRGEPNPFYYSNNVSSFGTIDLCGMEKPPFYYYKSWWTDEPVLKLTPHWNHKEGEKVSVVVFTNCEEITLSLNGKALETKRVGRFDAPQFEVEFEPGILSVEGTRNGMLLRDELVTSGETAEVRCTSVLEIKKEDEIGIYEINAYETNGVFCPMASDEIEICVENGSIVGVGNGDPSSFEYEQKTPEEDAKFIKCFNIGNSVFWIPTKKENALPKRMDWLELESERVFYDDDFRLIAKLKISCPKDQTTELVTTIRDVEEYEYVEFERLGGQAKVYLNGEFIGDNIRWHGRQSKNSNRPYRFYGEFQKGANELKIVFVHDTMNDLPLISGYVKIAKRVETPWKVRLHYGKARVFVKSQTPKQLNLVVKVK
jgi:hypothetical protein